MDELPSTSKECSSCGNHRAHDHYRKWSCICKPCINIKDRARRLAHKELVVDGRTKVCSECHIEHQLKDMEYGRTKCKECVLIEGRWSTHKPTADMPSKTCTKCDIEKPATDFAFRNNQCNECRKHNMYEWRDKNPERFKEHLQKYRGTPEYLAKRSLFLREKYHNDIQNRLSQLCRTRVRTLVKNKRDGLHHELIGCSYGELVKWLEFNFDDSMTWENFGEHWHIDHVLPCSSFDLADEEQQRTCFHWTNLSPLLKIENLKKGGKISALHIDKQKERVIEYQNRLSV